MSEPSICIPLVSSKISKKTLLIIFQKVKLGKIKRIDVIPKNNFNTIFIHFYYWYNNKNAILYKNKLINNENIFITSFEKPILLKCVLNKSYGIKE